MLVFGASQADSQEGLKDALAGMEEAIEGCVGGDVGPWTLEMNLERLSRIQETGYEPTHIEV